MTLRRKTLIIFSATSVLLLLLFIVIANEILVGGFKDLERQMAKTDVERARNGVQLELGTLETMLSDWAPWDDTYSYLQTRDEKYVSSNLVESTFASQRLNLFILLDNAGKTVYAQGFDLSAKAAQPIPHEVFDYLREGSPLIANSDVEKHVSGLVMLSQGPMLIASRPVTDSEQKNSPNGMLIVGRYLDETVLQRISDAVQLKVQAAHPDIPSVAIASSRLLEPRIQAVSDAVIIGDTVLNDLYGVPVVLLRVEQERLIHRQGQVTKQIFLGAIVFAGIVFVALVLILIERNVLAKVAKLSLQVNTLAQNQDLTKRLSVVGHDELSILASNINSMLKALEESQEKLFFMARHDSLTGLYNRAYFEQRIKQLRPKEGQWFLAIVCDVDGLKLINDTLGHARGDELLQAAANVLREACPAEAVFARTGGDEFAALIVDHRPLLGEEICQRIQNVVERYNISAAGVLLCISAGCAAGGPDTDIEELFKAADASMYRQKLLSSQSARSAIVHTLKKTLEARDFITEGHASRLDALVTEMGEALQLTSHQLADLQLLAQFHDIGKVGIPDAILFKPGSLTPEEQAIMRSHSEIGHRIAQAAPDLAPISDLILKHHEWWNGQGYPLGIKANQIPLECRILAIADAYDAMTSDRPYRKAMASHDALEELLRCSGSQFDPSIVALFAALHNTAKPVSKTRIAKTEALSENHIAQEKEQ